MTKQIKRTYKNCSLTGTPFSPCVTDGLWLISRWDVVDTDTRKQSLYLFGIDGVEVTIYGKQSHRLTLEELIFDTIMEHLEKVDFDSGVFRFEFDKSNSQFYLCKEEPKWSDYDCGQVKYK